MDIDNILQDYDLDNDKDYKKIEGKINYLINQLEFVDNEKQRKKINGKILEIKELLKNRKTIEKTKTNYPDYNSNKFIEKLLTKKEFAMNKINNSDISSLKKDFFELTNNQKFLKKLISTETPYKTIYLYHGVGVGKTCASIQIAHNFKDYYKKKVLVLLPSSTLKSNYKKELFNIAKYSTEDDNIDQCLGNYYLHQIIGRQKLDTKRIIEKSNKLINSDYEFLGYQEFVNKLEKFEKNSPNKQMYLQKIKNYFDNRVIIVDEIHNMRMIKDKSLGKKVPKKFHYVLDKLVNNVLVLLSATPMFNDYKEIKFILNTLLINNKDKPIDDKINILDKNNELNDDFKDILIKTSTKFISYMRGENPYTFPIRLYPSINKDDNVLKKSNYPKKDIYNKEITDDEQIKFLELIQTNMSSLQNKIYNTLDGTLDNTNNDENIESTDLQQKVQVSNIVFPSDKIMDNNKLSDNFDIKNCYGKTGLANVFNINEKDQSKLKLTYKKEIINNYGAVLNKNNIAKYSPKIKQLLDYIRKSEGIVLVYSRYIYSGIIPIAVALEHAGYKKYSNNILNKPKSDTTQKNLGNYIIISGNNKLSPNIPKEIAITNDKENKDGNNIKVIIISESGTEGLDFKNIRQVHIFEPWYNVNRLEQIIGRAVRNYSHFDLPEAKRNTTIYQYVNLSDNKNVESIDFRMYRISENKQNNISKIEKIMKENSIDCNLNEEILSFKDINKNIITSDKSFNGSKLIKYDIGDKPFSRLCDYGECDFKCSKKVSFDNINDSSFNKDIMYYEIYIMRKYITEYFKKNNIATFKKIKNDLQIEQNEILSFALNDIVNEKLLFRNEENRLGYLIYRSNSYIFQPSDINDDKILLKERKQSKISRPKRVDITNIGPVNTKYIVPDSKIVSKNNDNTLDINRLVLSKYEDVVNKLKFNDEILEKNKKYIWDIIIDNLNYDELLQLYKGIFKNSLDEIYIKNIKKSLNRSYLYINDSNKGIIALYDYYNDTYMCYNNNKLEKCSPIKNNEYKTLLNKKIKDFGKRKIKSYGFIEISNNELIYKIVNLDKETSKGTSCINTSTITNKKLLKFIKTIDNDNIIKPIITDDYKIDISNNKGILKNNYSVKKASNKKEFSKTNLCTIYQLLLRKLNTKENIYFIRPSIYKQLNKN